MVLMSESNPEEVLGKQGELRLEVSGRSMQPLLKEKRNTVHICLLTESPRLLDVVLFRRHDGSFVLHRITSICEDTYTFCGDNQIEEERGIRRQQLVGRMEGYYRGERYHACSSMTYRLYAQSWNATRPLRKIWAGLIRRLREKV